VSVSVIPYKKVRRPRRDLRNLPSIVRNICFTGSQWKQLARAGQLDSAVCVVAWAGRPSCQ
jgi:hypothetical protein